MKIAITGGAGFIGSHLTKAYLDAGHDVLVIDTLLHDSLEAIDTRARFYRVDIRDSALKALFQRERPDIVSHHAAARTEVSQPLEECALLDADVHVRGLLNVLESCVEASVSKFIFASGGNGLYGQGGIAARKGHDRYGDVTQHMRNTSAIAYEDTPLCLLKPYNITKAAGEGYVRYFTQQYGLPHTILRYADVYGETDMKLAHHPLTYFLQMLFERRRPIIRGSADEACDHICIDDVVRANLGVLTRGQNKTLHISSGEGHSLRELFTAVARYVHSPIEPLYLSQPLSAGTASWVLDNTQAYHVLDWRPEQDFATRVQQVIERFCEQQRWNIPVEIMHSSINSERYLVGAR